MNKTRKTKNQLSSLDTLFKCQEKLVWDHIHAVRLLEEYYDSVRRLSNSPCESL